MGEQITQYRVGIARVSILREGEGRYRYVVDRAAIESVSKEIRKNVEMIILSGGDVEDGNPYSLFRTALKILKLGRERVSEARAAYAFREEVKYRKLQVLIDDPYVEDISIVGPGPVWVRHSAVMSADPATDYIPTNIVIEDNLEFLEYLNLLSERAGRIISKANPIVDANLPEEDGGHRIHLVHPDIADGRGEIVIRKKKPASNTDLRALIRMGSISNAVVELIRYFIRRRGSILIVGPPGSGKTTLLRAILYSLVPKHWKVVIIEDTPEIDPLPGSCWVRYVVPLPQSAGSNVLDQMALTKAALRSSVNRFIVIGETRGAEARVLVQAMNMGMGGLTTFHGGTASEALVRLTSPPIGLAPHQVSMFNLIITVNYVVNGGLRRAVTAVDEPIYDPKDDEVYLNRLYEFGEDLSIGDILKRMRRAPRVAEQAIINEQV